MTIHRSQILAYFKLLDYDNIWSMKEHFFCKVLMKLDKMEKINENQHPINVLCQGKRDVVYRSGLFGYISNSVGNFQLMSFTHQSS